MFSTIETKVIAAAAGAGGGGAVSGFVLWLLGVLFWGAPSDANHAAQAAAAVPGPVSALVAVVLVILGAFLAGYAAPHTPRPDLHATPIGELVRSQGVAPVDAPAVSAPEPAADSTATAEPLPAEPAATDAAPAPAVAPSATA
jgi:hypothetical protein